MTLKPEHIEAAINGTREYCTKEGKPIEVRPDLDIRHPYGEIDLYSRAFERVKELEKELTDLKGRIKDCDFCGD